MRKKYFGSKLGPGVNDDFDIGAGPPMTPGGKPYDANEPDLKPKKAAPTTSGKEVSGTAKGGGAAQRGLKYRSC